MDRSLTYDRIAFQMVRDRPPVMTTTATQWTARNRVRRFADRMPSNGNRREGLNPEDAIRMAGLRRFRPIILTTLDTFGGLAPMIF